MSDRPDRPIRAVLDAELDESDVPRLWEGVEARRAARRTTRRAARIAGVAAALGLAIGAGWWLRGGEDAPAAARAGLEAAPFLGPLSPGRRVSFADGSWIEAGPEGVVELLQNGPRDVALHLRAGRVEVEVTPGGPRRWVVEAGPARVEVVGTHFVVERREAIVRVAVSRGAVVVRHAELPDGLRRLSAGESVEVGRPRPEPNGVRSQDVLPPPPSSPPAATRESARPWRALAQAGEYDEAYGALGPGGTRRAASGASADELMELADVARHSGHPDEAVAPLARLLSHHASDPSAPFAAFMLGQIELDHLQRPRDAAAHFERALREGLPGALAGDARARLALARERSGDAPGARAAACEYLAAHPDGPRTSAMARRCPDPEAPR